MEKQDHVDTVLITNGNILSMISLGDWIVQFGAHVLKAIFITTRLPSSKSNVGGLFSMLRRSGYDYTYFKLWTNIFFPLQVKRIGLPSNITELCTSLGLKIPIIRTGNINDPKMIQAVKEFDPSILLSFSATQKFCDELIDVPSRVALNAHYALLPEYGGISPYFWYLKNKESICGATLHIIKPELDTGPVIERSKFAIDDSKSVTAVLLKQMKSISPMLNHFYEGKTSENHAVPQDLSRRTYYGHPARREVREFKQSGLAFIHPNDRKELLNLVKGIERQSTDK